VKSRSEGSFVQVEPRQSKFLFHQQLPRTLQPSDLHFHF
jgi:hypothetical protein